MIPSRCDCATLRLPLQSPPMPKLTAEIPNELSRQIDRIIRDGWFPDQESVIREALLAWWGNVR